MCESDLTCKTNIVCGTRGHVENPEIKKNRNFTAKKEFESAGFFFRSVAFGQANYIFILASADTNTMLVFFQQ